MITANACDAVFLDVIATDRLLPERVGEAKVYKLTF